MLDLFNKLKPTLDVLEVKYKTIEQKLSSPDIGNNISKMTKLKRDIASLESTYVLYQKLKINVNNYKQAKEIVNLNVLDLVDDAKKEIISLEKVINQDLQTIQILLLPKDENDNRNVIVEIRGAAGGDEANIFAGDLFRMYSRYVDTLDKFKFEVISAQTASSGGYSQISFSITGQNAYSLFKWESGAHRVQRVPKTESKGRVHTSTATVLVMPEADDIDIEIKPNDLKIDTFKSQGAGGQSVNTTDSAVRITHLPTGIMVTSQDQKSQHKNKAACMKLIKTKVFDHIQQQEVKKRGDEAKSKIGTGDRSEKIRTYNYPQNRVTDHRIKLTINKLDQIMEGSMQQLIDGLIAEDKRQKIGASQK